MITPTLDRIVIEPHEVTEQKIGNIIVAGNAGGEDEIRRGTVVAVGPGGTGFDGQSIPVGVNVGDTVLFQSFRGWFVRDTDGSMLKLLDEKDVFGTIA